MPNCRTSCQASLQLLLSGALHAADAALTDERQGVMTLVVRGASE
jgi:hypothetical protein